MIRIAIVEDQDLIRGALAALLSLEKDIQVLDTAKDGAESVELVRACYAEETPIDVLLMDIEMPTMNGFTACSTIREEFPNTRVLMLTTFGRAGYVHRAFAAGASGFVVKDAPAETLAEQIRQIHQGLRVIDPQLAVESMQSGLNPLSEREQEVLRAAEAGGTIEDIAQQLHLAPGTVRNHCSAAITKTGTRNRSEAAYHAREQGWL